ncbi:MAG: CvpA family protein [Alphaproteobacteria bacterium]|nr:CvpA family protein [Alphaproteobacteria bacterium]
MSLLDDLAFNWFDLAALAVVLLSGIFALSRGLVVEVLSVLGWIGAAVITVNLFEVAQPYGRQIVPITIAADVATGLVLFIGSLIILSLLSRLIARAINAGSIGFLDRILGFLFGLVRGVALLAIVYVLFSQIVPVPDHPHWLREARSTPVLIWSGNLTLKVVPSSLRPADLRQKLDNRAGHDSPPPTGYNTAQMALPFTPVDGRGNG